MKKKLAILLAVAPFIAASKAFAQSVIEIIPPKSDGKNVGYSDLGKFVSNVLSLAFGLALLFVLVI